MTEHNKITPLLQAALSHARRGWPVFPAWWPVDGRCACPKGQNCESPAKHPLTGRGFHDATTDPATIRQRWERWPLANVALATGAASGVVVLDIDGEAGQVSIEALEAEHGPLPVTPDLSTGKGRHIYFSHPGGKVKNSVRTLGDGLDIRGDGGYVLVEPSIHVSGRRYEFDAMFHPDEIELAPMPEWLLALTEDKPKASPAKPLGDTIPQGQRNDTLASMAGSMRRRGMSEQAIYAALMAENETRCNPPLAPSEVQKIAQSVGHYPPGDGGAKGGHLPQIIVSSKFMRDVTDEAMNALQTANADKPFLFVRGNALVRLVRNQGHASGDALNKDSLRGVLDRAANFVTTKVDKDTKELIEVPARPPVDVVADILALPEYEMPQLRAIAGAPVLLPSGEFLLNDGYDAGSGLYLYLNGLGGSVRHNMPLRQAVRLLVNELLTDFPFVDDASLAHVVAHLILPFVRHFIHGPTPLLLLDAPTRGTGKGLLADLIAYITLGHLAAVNRPPDNEDEARKTITALLVEGSPLILLDNVHRLSSAALCAVLTATLWRDRVLGQSKVVQAPNLSTWIATGNNVTLSDEMARRTILSRLDAEVERPEDRTEFKHPLPAWAMQNRGQLVSACLSIIAAWLAAGAPRGSESLGRFEDWAEVMGGILTFAGIDGFLANRDEMYASADAETDEWTAFCGVWWEIHRELAVTAKDLLPLAKSHTLLMDIWAGRKEINGFQRLGHALRSKRDRVYGKFTIRAAGNDSQTRNKAYVLHFNSERDAE